MGKAEYLETKGCPQRDSAEHEEYVGALSVVTRETEEADGADLLERILSRENLNRAYKKVKANGGAPGIDGMTIEADRTGRKCSNFSLKLGKALKNICLLHDITSSYMLSQLYPQ